MTALVPLVLYYGLDFRLDHYGRDGQYTCRYLKSDVDGATELWFNLAFFVGPLATGLIAYLWIVLAAPGRLGRTRWRCAIGLPVAAAVVVALFFAALSGWLIYSDCPS